MDLDTERFDVFFIWTQSYQRLFEKGANKIYPNPYDEPEVFKSPSSHWIYTIHNSRSAESFLVWAAKPHVFHFAGSL